MMILNVMRLNKFHIHTDFFHLSADLTSDILGIYMVSIGYLIKVTFTAVVWFSW